MCVSHSRTQTIFLSFRMYVAWKIHSSYEHIHKLGFWLLFFFGLLMCTFRFFFSFFFCRLFGLSRVNHVNIQSNLFKWKMNKRLTKTDTMTKDKTNTIRVSKLQCKCQESMNFWRGWRWFYAAPVFSYEGKKLKESLRYHSCGYCMSASTWTAN